MAVECWQSVTKLLRRTLRKFHDLDRTHMNLQPSFPTTNRVIWLRRPARLVESDVAIVAKALKADIDAAWNQMVRENPHLTDGPCWHVLGVGRDGHGGATIHVTRTTYRMGAVRGLGVATGFAGLGTKAIAHWQGRQGTVFRSREERSIFPACHRALRRRRPRHAGAFMRGLHQG